MCGEDGAQREVYKLKEEPEKGIGTKKGKKRNEETERKRREESKRGKLYYSLKKNIHETDSKPETDLRGDLGGKYYC